jgi:hypothetical protein
MSSRINGFPNQAEVTQLADKIGACAESSTAETEPYYVETVWFNEIRADFAQGNISFIAGAKKLITAKADMKGVKGCSFIRLVEKLGMDLSTAERLMKIARHPVLGDSAHAPNLPVSWMVLYTLAALSAETLEQFIADGTVHPGLERKQAECLVRKARESNSNGGGVCGDDRDDDRGDTHDDDGGDAHDRDGGDAGGDTGDGDVNIDSCAGAEPKTEDASPTQPATRDITVGPDSPGEIQRKLARLEELERENRRQAIQLTGYESEIEEMKAAAAQTPKPDLITTEALAALTLPKFLAIMPAEWRPELMSRARTGKSVADAAEPFLKASEILRKALSLVQTASKTPDITPIVAASNEKEAINSLRQLNVVLDGVGIDEVTIVQKYAKARRCADRKGARTRRRAA